MMVVTEIKEQIVELQNKLKKIQDECNHPQSCLEKSYDGNSGNYDPSADCYWINFHCKLCDKKWTEDQ